MLSRTKESQLEKATNMVRDVVKHAQAVTQDERLRADFRSALDHGAKASRRLKNDMRAGSYTRVVSDKKLRKDLRAMLDDLDEVGGRIRGKSHRIRNALLLLAGAVGAAFAFPRVRAWLQARAAGVEKRGGEPEPLT